MNGRTAVLEKETSFACGQWGSASALSVGYIDYFLSTGKEDSLRANTEENLNCAEFIANLPEITCRAVFGDETAQQGNRKRNYRDCQSSSSLRTPTSCPRCDPCELRRPTNDNVSTLFGSGCGSLVMQVLIKRGSESPKRIGLTDITARKYH